MALGLQRIFFLCYVLFFVPDLGVANRVAEDLRGHVAGATTAPRGAAQVPLVEGRAEVGQHRPPVEGEEDVLGLDVLQKQ